MQYTYRHLSKPDVALFKELLSVFGEAFGESDTQQKRALGESYLQSLLAKQHFIAVAALCESIVVGGLAAYELQKFEEDRREIYIYDLAVSAPHRRKGVATTLVHELRRIAKERDAYVIFVQSDVENTAAIRLYESLGTREIAYHFDIPID